MFSSVQHISHLDACFSFDLAIFWGQHHGRHLYFDGFSWPQTPLVSRLVRHSNNEYTKQNITNPLILRSSWGHLEGHREGLEVALIPIIEN